MESIPIPPVSTEALLEFDASLKGRLFNFLSDRKADNRVQAAMIERLYKLASGDPSSVSDTLIDETKDSFKAVLQNVLKFINV